ncbi:hypothetical protein ES708_11921 [subsurface metagenome]
MVVLLVDNEVNIGVLILQMRKFSLKIKEAIVKNQEIMTKLEMTEQELKTYLRELKKKVFQST